MTTTAGAVLVMVSLFLGGVLHLRLAGHCPPWARKSPARGWTTTSGHYGLAGVGTTLCLGINLIVLHHQDARPGMNLMKMPVFTWTALCTNALIVASFPVLTAVLVLMSLDRYVPAPTSSPAGWAATHDGVNLIWIWGHPQGVHPGAARAFGVFSEVVADLLRQTPVRLHLHGGTPTVCITILSYLVWLHHFFTMGSGASVNTFFGITTMIISIPTGAKRSSTGCSPWGPHPL